MASRERKRGAGALHCIPTPGEEDWLRHVNVQWCSVQGRGNECLSRSGPIRDRPRTTPPGRPGRTTGRGVPSPPQVERVKKLRHRGHPSASPGSVNSERRLVGLAIIMRPLASSSSGRAVNPPRRRSTGRAPPGQHMGERV